MPYAVKEFVDPIISYEPINDNARKEEVPSQEGIFVSYWTIY